MATFDASTSDDLINIYDASFVEVGSYTIQSPTVLQYLATDGTTLITLTGTFTYSGGLPVSGAVSQIEFDTSNDSDTDISISYSPAESPDVLDLIASANSFWFAALEHNDTINPSTVPAPGFVIRYYYGDFLTLDSGETFVSGNDLLEYGGGGGDFHYYADGTSNGGNLTGGDDTVSFLAYQPRGALFLDVSINQVGAVLIGGDDIVTISAPSVIDGTSTLAVYGDSNTSSGTLTGGDDNIDVLFTANVTAYGDARLLSAGSLIGGNDIINGSTSGAFGGGDVLFGDVDTISNGTTFTGGDDIIMGNGGSDTIFGDFQFNLGGTIISEGNDELDGGNGDDFVYGNGGDDIIDGGKNDDIMDGGAGTDTASYDSSFLAVTVSLALQGSQQDTIGLGLDTLTNFENLSGSRYDDTLTGDANANTISGELGDDTLDGGAGTDTVSYASATSGVTVSLGLQGIQQDTVGAGLDTFSNFENLTGSGHDDTLIGNNSNNTINGGVGSDTTSYSGANSGVNVYLQYTGRDTGGAGVDTLISIENVTGSDYDDRLVADAADNLLIGGDGNDLLKGKGGTDTFYGNDGDDKIIGGAGNDTMFGGSGNDVLTALSGLDTLNGGADDDFLYGGQDADILNGDGGIDKLKGNRGEDTLNGGEGDDDLRGGAQNDILNGGDGVDYLFGENHEDTLNGGAGNDVLTGGAGGGVFDGLTDTFVYVDTAGGGGGFDRVKDYENGIDLIDLQSFGLGNFAAVQALASDSGSGLRINFGSGDVLFIENFNFASFDASDVLI